MSRIASCAGFLLSMRNLASATFRLAKMMLHDSSKYKCKLYIHCSHFNLVYVEIGFRLGLVPFDPVYVVLPLSPTYALNSTLAP